MLVLTYVLTDGQVDFKLIILAQMSHRDMWLRMCMFNYTN